jgi:CheY-like chemotaxis protein
MTTPPPTILPQQPWYLTFHDLMPHRVREILLVSSPYDAFTLEEDGRLTERIFTEYSELNLSTAPRITHAPSGARAMELMAERHFDMVLTMVRIPDTDVSAFGRRVKETHPRTPVVLLVLTEADLGQFPGGVDPKGVDHVFWWTGDARILLAIIKLVEDRLNAPLDTRAAGVRVIIVVEDSIRRYSSFLSLLYAELMAQSNSLIAEGVNELHRLTRMRARPKLLLARTYEEAVDLFNTYREYVQALVTDVTYPRGGQEDENAGFKLVELVQSMEPALPILMQSAQPENAARAAELGVAYADKNSDNLLRRIRVFVTENLGFGEFVFRLPDGTEVGRARDMYGMEQALRTVPAASVSYHSNHNHFSLWMNARCMFDMARLVRPRTVEEFSGSEDLRRYLLKVMESARLKQQEGVVTELSSARGAVVGPFVRLGKGSIGGKARGLAFVNSLLARHNMASRYGEMAVQVPRSLVVPTDEFDRFMDQNHVLEEGQHNLDSRTILRRCLAGRLSEPFMRDLRSAVATMSGPLAVRSSSLLEDSQLQPFAGVYATFMLPNNHPDPEVRFADLCQAIKAVYASTYSEDARAYMAGTPYSIEEERMAVLVQEVAGRAHGTRFYPTMAGVAVSYNYYPVGPQKADDGLVMLALGLGQTVVQGGTTLQFSPRNPSILPQFRYGEDYLRCSQTQFFALDLGRVRVDLDTGSECSLRPYGLDVAEEDGSLGLVASVYSREDDIVRDNLSLRGPRVVTFHNILKWNALPLAAALSDLLDLFKEGMGCAVEVEFAVEAGDWGRPPQRGREPELPTLYVLQVRPQATQQMEAAIDTEGYPPGSVLCHTDRSMGHGVVEGIHDVVYVPRDDLEAHETPAVAAEVAELNTRLRAEGRPYLLVGPGRWGSSDPRLGIPVKWAHISGAKIIVETAFKDRDVEPSQGAHFFHNVTSFRIGYLTLSHADRSDGTGRVLDAAWLGAQPTAHVGREVRHIRLEHSLRVLLDGRRSAATILKPGTRLQSEVDDDEEGLARSTRE